MAEHFCNRENSNKLQTIKTLSVIPQYEEQIIRHVTELQLHINMNSEDKPLIHSLKEWTKPPHKGTEHHNGPSGLSLCFTYYTWLSFLSLFKL